MWWLVVAHWQRMQGHFAQKPQRQVPWTAGTFALGLVATATGVAFSLLGGLVAAGTVDGWFLGSGGTRYADWFAARGVGQGDRLIAGQRRAEEFGAVESDLFLDSELPSLYDLFSDLYGEPLRKNRQVERAIGLVSTPDTSRAQHLPANHQAGREFSTVRRPPSPRRSSQRSSRDSQALAYVTGRVPIHLRLETFDAFDGQRWTRSAASSSTRGSVALTIRSEGGRPWLRIDHPTQRSAALSPEETHVLRIIQLKTNRIPTPAHPVGLHIDRVDQRDFYGWTEDDVLELPVREQIPPLQVIHLRSRSVDAKGLEAAPQAGPTPLDKYCALPTTPYREQLEALAHAWAGALPRGYPQVEAIVARLRSGSYRLDPAATLPADCADTAAYFLLESQRGPDYLFATSAAVLLRALGYPARVCAGLYVSPARFDRLAGQTPVLPEDVHVWGEVCMDEATWFTVEPTPGYEVLPPLVPWWRQVAWGLKWLWRQTTAHPLAWTLWALAVLGSFTLRRQLLDCACTIVWWLWQSRSPSAQVLATLWLVERRASLAGCPRPAHITLDRWYRCLNAQVSPMQRAAVETWLRAANRLLYAPPRVAWGGQTLEPRICQTCREVVRSVTMRRLRQFSALSRPGNGLNLVPWKPR
jgi:hypothetical protein